MWHISTWCKYSTTCGKYTRTCGKYSRTYGKYSTILCPCSNICDYDSTKTGKHATQFLKNATSDDEL